MKITKFTNYRILIGSTEVYKTKSYSESRKYINSEKYNVEEEVPYGQILNFVLQRNTISDDLKTELINIAEQAAYSEIDFVKLINLILGEKK